MKKSNIYTKTGDAGTTVLVGGVRIPKTDDRLEAYGTIDEFVAHLGLLITYLNEGHDRQFLLKTQQNLFTVGSYLATDQGQTELRKASIISPKIVEDVEHEIDRIDSDLPPLRDFVLPGGSRTAAICHVCRTICRRAERRIAVVAQNNEVAPELLAYVNRLSDYLFDLSRHINVEKGREEIFWHNHSD
jgi:cob(I)alamin adenosyltransferase